MTREELQTAWLRICEASEEGDFKVSCKKGQWKVEISSFMDAGIAHAIVTYMAAKAGADVGSGGEDWSLKMFE